MTHSCAYFDAEIFPGVVSSIHLQEGTILLGIRPFFVHQQIDFMGEEFVNFSLLVARIRFSAGDLAMLSFGRRHACSGLQTSGNLLKKR